jgi:hypothetical protein
MVWSSDAVARYTLFGDHAMSDKPFVCPFKLRISSPEKGDHILATLSAAFRNENKRCISDRVAFKSTHAKLGKKKKKRQGRYLPQEASNVPSGLNLTEDIDMVWPRSVCLSS